MKLVERLETLTPRERTLVLGFSGFVGALVLLALPLYMRLTLSEAVARNEAISDLIRQIEDERPALANRKEEVSRIEQRYARKAPALAGFLGGLAEQVGLQIPETQDRATAPRGKTFKERQTRIKLTKTGMLPLANFLEKFAQSGYSVAITHLDLQKRNAKPDEFDVEIDVSGFDKEEVKKAPTKAADEERDAE